MTLIVAVGNKNGLSVSADSIGSVGHKTFSVNKIFRLSNSDPVGIAVCGSSDFMNTLIEIIIKDYRKSSTGDPKNTVKEYVDSFIGYLNSADYIGKCSISDLVTILSNGVLSLVEKELNQYLDEMQERGEKMEVEVLKEKGIEYIKNKIKDQISIFSQNEQLPEINGPTIEEYGPAIKENMGVLKSKVNDLIGVEDGDLLNIIEILITLTFKKDIIYLVSRTRSQLIFFGYGDKEYNPVVTSINLYYKLNGCIVYGEGDLVVIDKGFIHPFAQADEVYAALQGMSESVKRKTHTSINENLTKLKESHTITDEALKICEDSIVKGMQVGIDTYMGSLMDAVNFLSKDDLARTSENLVSIGSLKKRVSMGDETVGGPIDVAVVTKSDGFVWIKRKNYYDSEINKHIK